MRPTAPVLARAAAALVLLANAAPGCDPPGPPTELGGDATADGAPVVRPDASPACTLPSSPVGPEVELAPPFDTLYTAYDLGPAPGVPSPLGGTVIVASDPDTLLVAGQSERAEGAVYRIGVTRDACGHIIGFDGSGTQVATTPYVDANLVSLPGDLLVFTEWPMFTFSQIVGSATMPTLRTDLRGFGMPDGDDRGPGGLGVVPAGLAGAGELRLVTWPAGRWFHLGVTAGTPLTVTGIDHTATLPNQPGGFAYVPAGSPGFPVQSLIVAEWHGSDADHVAVYEVDAAGDPVPGTRREFFSRFPRPWGAYFEPVTGDYLFLSWGSSTADRVYVVQGFVPPPPID